jgi:hypothetical protein
MAQRQKRKIEGPDLTGSVVSYQPHPESKIEYGRVKRMGSCKIPCCFVIFHGEENAKLCYVKDLKIQK